MANIDIENITKKGLTNVSADMDGVHFDLIPLGSKGTKNAAFANRSNSVWNTSGTGEWQSAVNAVDIDWNSAQLGSYIIQSTGQLLSYMTYMMGRIEDISYALTNL